MRTYHLHIIRNCRGFTLVEVLITAVISLIIMVGVAGVFVTHSRTYSVHDDVAALQQGVRGVLMVMPAEFRVAGCDPLGTKEPGIRNADATRFEFTADLGGDSTYPNEADGKINWGGEHVDYIFMEDYTGCPGDKNRKKRENGGRGVLCRKVMPMSGNWQKARHQALADDIERLEFNYILWDHKEKKFSTSGGEALQGDDIARIAAVQISMLVRGELEDPQYYYQGEGFKAGSGKVWKLEDIYRDAAELEKERRHRRRLVITTVQLRNMGGN